MTEMKTRTVVIGLVILVVGIALVVVGAVGALGSLTINTTFTQPHPGEYVSAEIVLNTTSGLVVSSPAAVSGIVRAQDLGSVNSTNLNRYAVPYNSTAAGSDVYKSISGNYYYVAFSSGQPDTRILATTLKSGIVAFGSLALIGIVLVLAGIVVAVVGALQKSPAQVEGRS